MPKFLLGIALLLINASAIAAPGVTIHPSGDMTGATDQANIHFENTRGGIHLLGGFAIGDKVGNVGEASVTKNTFNDTLIADISGLNIGYPVEVTDNEIQHATDSGNYAIGFETGNGPLTISGNKTDGLYFAGNILLFDQTGGSLISGNTVNGGAFAPGWGAIEVDFSDDVLITGNNLKHNPFIPG
ncbi:MAG: hypothetical protein V3S33_04845 [Gammaproteobacteria bacterium]